MTYEETLNQAIAVVLDDEIRIITELEAALKSFLDEVPEPDEETTPVRPALGVAKRIRATVQNQLMYEINTLKTQYNLVQDNAPA